MTKQKLEVFTVKPETSFIFNDEINRIIDFQTESSLDDKISKVENYLKNTSGKGMSETEKDSLYAVAQTLHSEFKSNLREAKFNFYFNRAQYNLVTDLLLKKLEYDVNTVFIAIELKDLLDRLYNTKFNNEEDLKVVQMDPTELTYLYHLIKEYKVKGLTKEAYTFAGLLTRIGDVSKIINYYDTKVKSLVEDIQKWALALDGSENLLNELDPSTNLSFGTFAENQSSQVDDLLSVESALTMSVLSNSDETPNTEETSNASQDSLTE